MTKLVMVSSKAMMLIATNHLNPFLIFMVIASLSYDGWDSDRNKEGSED
jgi:hypothetical protein